MPSEMMNHCGISPSCFHEEMRYADERQLGAWKIDHISGHYGGKANGALRVPGVASSPLENKIPLDNQMKRGFDLPEYYLSPGRNVNPSSGKHFAGAENAASRTLLVAADHDIGARTTMNKESASCFLNEETLNIKGAQYENSLFSSSMSHLLSRKLKVSSNNAIYSQSVTGAATSNYEEEGAFESLEELEAQTIGNLLPDDDDLFSGVSDGLDSTLRPSNGDDLEDQDLFSNVGGMELGEDGSLLTNFVLSDVNSNNLHRGGSTHPSRTLFVRNINSNIVDSDLQKLFEQYGDVRTLYTANKHRGFVIVSYYDIRASCNAMKALQNKSLMRRKLDIHFSIPKENPSGKDENQGTVMVFNPDSSVSTNELHEIFGVYGDIMEVRESSHNNHHKYIEFFDIRAAESALHALNRSEKSMNFETNRPSGSKRLMESISSELEQEESGLRWLQHNGHANLTTAYSNNGTNVGHSRSANRGLTSPYLENMLHPGVSSSVPNGIPSSLRGEPGSRSSITESERLGYHMKFALQGLPNLPSHSPNLPPQSPNVHAHSPNLHARSPNLHPHSPNLHRHSLSEYYDGPTNVTSFGSPSTVAANINVQPQVNDNHQFHRINSTGHLLELNEVFGSSGNGSCLSPGHQYMWDNSHIQQSQAGLWPNSPSFLNGIGVGHPQQFRGVNRPPSMLNPLVSPNHHVGSAPSINHPIWERRHTYAGGESPDAAMFHPGSLGNTRISGNSLHPLELLSPDTFLQTGGNCVDMTIPSKSVGLHPHQQRCMIFSPRGQLIPMMGSYESPSERTRHRRTESPTTPADNRKQFELDVDRILRGDDKRTTLMIKNIPNKYTSKMLLAAIDERHKGTYDFIYLPIDFKNKCNVGYAFINITEPSLIVPFYQTFNGKKWEKFNSEKVATLAYARIQGKSALIAHFQNSSLMNEDKRCRPILFHTNGPNAGDQVPFPMSTNMRPRGGKTRTSNEENNQEMPSGFVIKDDCSNGDSSSGSGKESD